MKKNNFLSFLAFLLVIVIVCLLNLDKITNMFAYFLKDNPTVIISKANSYYKNANYDFVKQSSDFIPYSKQDLKNIFYSILNNGYDKFTFYCPEEYTDCLKDVNSISTDNNLLTHINNYVNPFNDFNSIEVILKPSGEVNVEVNKLYTTEEINAVNKKLDEIETKIITSDMKTDDKILAFHDYVINNTKYDTEKEKNNSNYKSNIAYGPLIEGYAVCGGYADAMALFLSRLNVPNFKIASETHVWNAVYINNKWLHLDLTWDDPVTENGTKDTLLHKFYLIDTKTLESYKISDHDYDKSIYIELS
jgi:hypothetical protein